MARPYAAFLQNAILPHTHTRGCTPGWYAVPRWGTQMDHRRPYPDPLRHPQWIVTGLVLAWWGNPHSELPQRGNAYQPRVQPWVRSLINQMRSEGTLHITRLSTVSDLYAAFLQNAILPPPIPGVAPRAGMPCPVGAPRWIIAGLIPTR